jgi:hypothetical protein
MTPYTAKNKQAKIERRWIKEVLLY